jgi:hypothetical protein
MMLITRKSPYTGVEISVDLPICQAQIDRYEAGRKAELAFANLEPCQIEWFVTGYTPEDFEAMRKEAETPPKMIETFVTVQGWRLVYTHTGKPVSIGAELHDKEHTRWTLTGLESPKHNGTGGKVLVKREAIDTGSFTPGVFGLRFERTKPA